MRHPELERHDEADPESNQSCHNAPDAHDKAMRLLMDKPPGTHKERSRGQNKRSQGKPDPQFLGSHSGTARSRECQPLTGQHGSQTQNPQAQADPPPPTHCGLRAATDCLTRLAHTTPQKNRPSVRTLKIPHDLNGNNDLRQFAGCMAQPRTRRESVKILRRDERGCTQIRLGKSSTE